MSGDQENDWDDWAQPMLDDGRRELIEAWQHPKIDIVERLRNPEQWRSFPDMDDTAPKEAADEIERLRQVCRNVYEVWAGSEGGTYAEPYLLHLLERMRDEAKEGLR